jgi:hypothetical protein
MKNDFTNLLPTPRRRALRREYFLRLGVVATLLVAVLTVAMGILLLPTYVFLAQSTRAKEARLASIEATFSSGDEAGLSARLSALSRDADTLSALGGALSVSAVIRAVLAVPRTSITLSSFTYTPASSAAPKSGAPATPKTFATLSLSGVATTRDALRSYQLALQAAPFARSADLPVSAYAKDTNNVFVITVALSPALEP